MVWETVPSINNASVIDYEVYLFWVQRSRVRVTGHHFELLAPLSYLWNGYSYKVQILCTHGLWAVTACGSKITPECGGCHRIQFPRKIHPHLRQQLCLSCRRGLASTPSGHSSLWLMNVLNVVKYAHHSQINGARKDVPRITWLFPGPSRRFPFPTTLSDILWSSRLAETRCLHKFIA